MLIQCIFACYLGVYMQLRSFSSDSLSLFVWSCTVSVTIYWKNWWRHRKENGRHTCCDLIPTVSSWNLPTDEVSCKKLICKQLVYMSIACHGVELDAMRTIYLSIFFLKIQQIRAFHWLAEGNLYRCRPNEITIGSEHKIERKRKKLMATKPATLVALVCHPNDAKR
jgi:hypothetical protein